MLTPELAHAQIEQLLVGPVGPLLRRRSPGGFGIPSVVPAVRVYTLRPARRVWPTRPAVVYRLSLTTCTVQSCAPRTVRFAGDSYESRSCRCRAGGERVAVCALPAASAQPPAAAGRAASSRSRSRRTRQPETRSPTNRNRRSTRRPSSSSASKTEEKLINAPATMTVISAADDPERADAELRRAAARGARA